MEFFDTIDALEAKLPEDVLVLPAHGKPFRGVHVRLEELRKEHADKLDILLQNAGQPRRVVDVFDDLFGNFAGGGRGGGRGTGGAAEWCRRTGASRRPWPFPTA